MKKISDTKNSDVKKINNSKGFTLVELLAVIAILSIVLTGVIFVAINVVDNAKEESYKVTINNIQADANSYVVEDNSLMPWMNGITSDYQFQCITVQNLIDTGYFKGDVLESEVADGVKVSADDFIYLERDTESKAITKNILLVGDKASYYAGFCESISTVGNISFTVKPEGWSKEKEITVTYNVHSNIDRVSNYKYDYIYEDINSNKKDKNGNFNKLTMVEKFEINENGKVSAKIKDGDNNLIINNYLIISKIDNIMPEASITSTNNVASSQTATLKMSDNAGVVAYYFGKNNPNSTAVTWTNIDSTTSKSVTGKVDSSGTWYLGVKDVVGHVVVVSKVFYKTTLSISNATVEPSTIITMSGNMFTIPTASPNAYYTFNGWYTSSSYSGSAITTYNPTKDTTIYGKVTENKLTGGSVKISGKSTYGETLTTTLTDTSPKADSYTYQWYYNSSNSKIGGTAISGATSSSYTVGSGLVGKYIYVVVTATKNNYRTTTFSDITDSSNNTTSTIAKRSLTITAKDQTITYGDSISTGTGQITSSGLASGDSVTAVTLTASTTNATSSGKITPSSATVKKDSTTVTDNYSISYKTGKLVINRKGVTIPTADAYCKEVTYNGSEQTITNTAGTGYSFSGNKKTNAGTYTVTATLNSNYKWSDNTTGTKTFDCSIAKKALTITAKVQTITYGDAISTGTGQITSTGLVSGHSITAITLKASTTNVTSNGTITPSAVTVKSGSTVVTSNYSISYKTGKLVINRKGVTVPTADAYCKAVTYNGSEQAITNSAGTGYSFSGNKKTNAGTYTVTATLNGNYKWSDNTTGTKTFDCSIAKKALTITAKAQTITYGDAISTGTGQITSTGLVSGHSITAITLKASTTNVTSNGTITPSAATVKSGSTVVTSNYSISYKTGKLVINKKSATIPTASAYCKSSLVYNGSEQTITNSAGTGYSFSGNKKKNAGEYTVTATLNGNYKWSDNTTGTKTFKCSIAKKAPTMTVSPTTLSLTVPTAGSFTYTYDGDGTVSCGSSSTTNATCKVDTSKKTVTVTPVASGSATITLSAAVGTNYSATSKNVSVTVVATYSVTYDANGGSGAPSAGTKTHGTDYTISSTKPKRDGYSFVKWTTNKDGSGTSYNPGDKYKTNAALKLYAQWEALTFETKYGYPKYQTIGSVWAWSVESNCTNASDCGANTCNTVGTIPKNKDIYYVQKDSKTSSSTYFIDVYVKVDDLSTVGAAVNPPSVEICRQYNSFKEPAYLEFDGDKYVYARIPAKCNNSSCGTFRCVTNMLIDGYCIYCSSRGVYTDPNIGACPNG